MKILAAFYSRTGNNKRAALEIAKQLKADIDEIADLKDRKGIKGLITAGRDAMNKTLTEIKTAKNPSEYDLVIVGTPVWAGGITPAIRTYLSKNKFKKVAFFRVQGGDDSENTFREMERVSKKPVAELVLKGSQMGKEDSQKKIKEFCDKCVSH